LCFYGHTHLPVVFEKQQRVTRGPLTKLKIVTGKRYFINVGSVGQPRDTDPRSAYVIYHMAEHAIEIRRLAYDIGKTQAKIRSAGLPERLAKRLDAGR
jgi:diadenosine tetraphosphatase ApaH/serine/threonine PP2A family protein phosphatase